MVERLISFAGSESGAYGCVALGSGIGDAAAFLARPEGSLALADAEVTRGQGTLRVTAPEGELIVGLAAQTSPLAFETGPSRRVTVQAVGASVELGAAPGRPAGGFEATGVSWALEGESDQSLLRTLWAALADGSVFVLFALRSADADEHGAETIGAARIAKDGAVTSYAEPLLSTEYDADGGHQRATLELWGEEEGGLPTRGAGRLELGGSVRASGAELHAARFGWRLEGTPGFGAYEIVG